MAIIIAEGPPSEKIWHPKSGDEHAFSVIPYVTVLGSKGKQVVIGVEFINAQASDVQGLSTAVPPGFVRLIHLWRATKILEALPEIHEELPGTGVSTLTAAWVSAKWSFCRDDTPYLDALARQFSDPKEFAGIRNKALDSLPNVFAFHAMRTRASEADIRVHDIKSRWKGGAEAILGRIRKWERSHPRTPYHEMTPLGERHVAGDAEPKRAGLAWRILGLGR